MRKNIVFTFSYLFLLVILSYGSKCGRPVGSQVILPSERVVAGYDVGYYRYPWYAALINSKQVSCGGALIASRTVLTAAHCFKEYVEANKSSVQLENVYTVRLGMYNICTTENTVTEYKVEKVQVHELYLTKKPYYDICLLTLANSTDSYTPICLPKSVPSYRPKEGTVPGMGTLKYQGSMPCTLHEARLLIYPDETCKSMINHTGNDASAIKNAFCAGYMTGGIDTCQGDSGGPLQVIDDNGNYVFYGIVSFGFHCALPGYLGMYTDVSQYIPWIKEKSESDLEFVSSLTQDPTTNPSSLENSNQDQSNNENEGHQKKKKHLHHEHPYHTPLRIIVFKNHRLVSIVKHYPIKRIP